MNISNLNLKQRSALFAELSGIAYMDEKDAKKSTKELGFTQIEFYNRDGAQAYRFQNKTDLVIACRGTQPSEFSDIRADLEAMPVLAETVGRVHKGFKEEVDELWPMILEDLDPKVIGKRKLWITGHSLGAAMATIIASRLSLESHKIPTVKVEELYTYGSPRVGWKKYVKTMPIPHYRWRNNNDIVTTVPPFFMGYVHHGKECYIDSKGRVRENLGFINKVVDKLRGMLTGLLRGRIDNFSDHSIAEYAHHLKGWSNDGYKK